MMKQTSLMTLGLLLATTAYAGGGGAPVARPATPAPAACRSIAAIVASDPNFSTLNTALQAADLSSTLASGEYTVFAPTNAAFAKLPSDELATVLNDPDMLRAVLLYHVTPGKVTAAQVKAATSINTVQGSASLVTVSGNRVQVDNATVTRADMVACNGLIHVIDTVLMPAMDTAETPVAEAPAAEAPAAETPAPAPEPAASAPASVSILSIPALPLRGATAGTAATTTTNTTTTETTTSTTDTTATTTETTSTTDTTATTTDTAASTETVANTCYDVLVADERFSTLRDLVSDAGLTETLMTDEYTIFAPTNEAFEAMDQDTLALVASDPETLKQVLLYHVISGKRPADQLTASVATAQGGNLDFKSEGSSLMIGEAKVDTTLVGASNCNIYAIDKVLVPADLKLPEPPAAAEAPAATTATSTTTATTTTATATTGGAGAILAALQGQSQYSTLLGLLQQAGLLDTLASGNYTLFAPTNDAFAKIPAADLATLQSDPAKLKAVLLNHVIAQRIGVSGLNALIGANVQSAGGNPLTFTAAGDRLKFGDALVTTGTALDVGNLTVYPIDTVVLPK